MDPILLQKQLRDNNADLQDYFKDIKEWGAEMKRKEAALKDSTSEPGEGKHAKPRKVKEESKNKIICKSKSLSKKLLVEENNDIKSTKISKDYKFWENFDVDAECEKIDQEKSDDSDLTDEFDDNALEQALEEKEKGNQFVKKCLYKEAIKCYSKAIEVYSYDATFFANRALCYLKLNQYKNAETDCTTALQIDKEYVKAYHRRATAKEALGQLEEAQRDLLRVLEFEPKNVESKKFLEKINKSLEANNDEEDAACFESQFRQSRKKSDKPKVDKKAPVIEAIKEHVYERKASKDASTIIKSTSVKSQLSWPAGEKVRLINPIIKAPKDRSKLPLKRLEVKESNKKNKIVVENITNTVLPNTSDRNNIIKNEENSKNDNKVEETRIFNNLDITIDLSKDDFSKLNMTVPKTAVEFNNNWKNLRENEMKYLYLRQIQPSLYPTIFKEALDSKIFSDILVTLSKEFSLKDVPVFNYLYGLTKVKRFTTLIMFASSEDKKALCDLFETLERSNIPPAELEYLKKFYEM